MKLISVALAALLLFLATGEASLAAPDGGGTMTVNPTSVLAGSTGNSLTFTFAVPGTGVYGSGSQLTLLVPEDWTAPQKSAPGSPGYVSVAPGTCSSASLGRITGRGPWTIPVDVNCSANTGFTLTYAGGGTKVTAPTSAGTYTFTTRTERPRDRRPVTGTSPVVTVRPAAVSASKSSLSASPSSVAANGTDHSTITATLLDAYRNPVSGKAVSLSQDAGHSSIVPGSEVTDSSGRARFTVKGTTVEKVIYTATDTTDGVTLGQTVQVTFLSTEKQQTCLALVDVTVPIVGKTFVGTVISRATGTASNMSVAWTFGGTLNRRHSSAAGQGTASWYGNSERYTGQVTSVGQWDMGGLPRPVLPVTASLADGAKNGTVVLSLVFSKLGTITLPLSVQGIKRLPPPFQGNLVISVTNVAGHHQVTVLPPGFDDPRAAGVPASSAAAGDSGPG